MAACELASETGTSLFLPLMDVIFPAVALALASSSAFRVIYFVPVRHRRRRCYFSSVHHTQSVVTTGARETTRCQTCTPIQVGWMAKTEQTVSGPTPSCLPLTCGYSRRCVMYRRERTSVAVMNRNKINKTKSRGRLRSLSVRELL